MTPADEKTAAWQEGFDAGRKAGAAELSQHVDKVLADYYAGEPKEPRRIVRECIKTLSAVMKQELTAKFGDEVRKR